MRELVIVIPDLYLQPEAGALPAAALGSGRFRGLESAGRFGERSLLGEGWRPWLAQLLGRLDLRQVAAAQVAAAALGEPPAPAATATRWIATPLHLTAGLARVHLDHRGLLALSTAELAALASEFSRTFGSSGVSLTPLPSGEFLLTTPGMAPLRTVEPARCIGADLAQALPQGGAAAPLRRLVTEIEMWLHAQPLNEARQQRREPPVTTLWPWGADGRPLPAAPAAAPRPLPLACGRDAWLTGLWHLGGGACRSLPEHLEELLGEGQGERAVLVAAVAAELQRSVQASPADALARLDERLIAPALAALRRGRLVRATLVLNDVRMTLGRTSRFKLWRRARAGLASFA